MAVGDRGLAYGDGVFETMLWHKGLLHLWPLHKQRLMRGCERLLIKYPAAAVDQHLAQVADALRARHDPPASAIIKLTLTRGQGGQGYRPPQQSVPSVAVQVLRHNRSSFSGAGVSLVDCTYRLHPNPPLAGIKHLNRLDYVLAATQLAGLPESSLLLLQDVNGQVIESLHHNIFVVLDGRLRTPDLHACGVEGVMREVLLKQQLFPAQVAALQPEALLRADEVFVCNSVRGIWPVVSYAHVQWAPGPVTKSLCDLINNMYGSAYAQ